MELLGWLNTGSLVTQNGAAAVLPLSHTVIRRPPSIDAKTESKSEAAHFAAAFAAFTAATAPRCRHRLPGSLVTQPAAAEGEEEEESEPATNFRLPSSRTPPSLDRRRRQARGRKKRQLQV